MTDMDFWGTMLAGFQQDPTDSFAVCVTEFEVYKTQFRQIIAATKTNLDYTNGISFSGAGTATDAGYWLQLITRYMDIPVLMTNLYNKCSIDYFMQRFGSVLSSLSGALDLVTNFLFRFFDTKDTQLYKDLSNGIDNNDRNAVGLAVGNFMKILFVVEIPLDHVNDESRTYESVRVNA